MLDKEQYGPAQGSVRTLPAPYLHAGATRGAVGRSFAEADRRDPAAFAVLFDRHAAALHRYVTRRLGDSLADDIVAETFLARVEARVSASAAQRDLAGALAVLSTEDREVLLLIAWADLSYAEVAVALGIPIGTVRSRLHRARRKTRAALGGVDPSAIVVNEEETDRG
jgi:DNA-directed RNA polymerase specialized sigma24 family protein